MYMSHAWVGVTWQCVTSTHNAYVCRVYYDICVTDPGTTVGVNTYATDPT